MNYRIRKIGGWAIAVVFLVCIALYAMERYRASRWINECVSNGGEVVAKAGQPPRCEMRR